MNKSILLFLLFVISIASTSYINFVPIPVDSSGECTYPTDQNINGLGYSILVDQCFTIDNVTSHIIQYGSENDTYIHSTYKSTPSGVAKCTGTPLSVNQYQENTCIEPVVFNSYFSEISGFNVNITISNSEIPIENIPPRSFVTVYTQNYCITEESIVAEYLTQGTSTTVGQYDVLFICKKGIPYTQSCLSSSPTQCSPVVNNGEICVKQQPTIYKSIYCSNNPEY